MTTTLPNLPPRFDFDLQLARDCGWPCVDETGKPVRVYSFDGENKEYPIVADFNNWAFTQNITIEGKSPNIYLSANLADPAVQRAVEKASREFGMEASMWSLPILQWLSREGYEFSAWDETIYLPTKLIAQLPQPEPVPAPAPKTRLWSCAEDLPGPWPIVRTTHGPETICVISAVNGHGIFFGGAFYTWSQLDNVNWTSALGDRKTWHKCETEVRA